MCPICSEVVLCQRGRPRRPGPQVHAIFYQRGRKQAARQIWERGRREVAVPTAILERRPLPKPDFKTDRERRLPGPPHRGDVAGDHRVVAKVELGEHMAARLTEQHCRAKDARVALREGETPLLTEEREVMRPNGAEGVVHEGDARGLGNVEVADDAPGADKQRAAGRRAGSGLPGRDCGQHLKKGGDVVDLLPLRPCGSQAEDGQQPWPADPHPGESTVRLSEGCP
mmetsp:Transcript_41613/g.129464  ORF Transcript_41613/g.129464 Transcript_41613/m.129464 type:complete len:227 (-) Transcript_41613:30-710(-)